MKTRTTSSRPSLIARGFACVAIPLAMGLCADSAIAQALPHDGLMQAYRQSTTYMASMLAQSNRQATIDAAVTAVAVHRALTSAINLDVVRLRAASRRVELGESALIAQVDAAQVERAWHLLFVGNWLGDGNTESRQAALDGTQKAINDTQAVLVSMAPLLQRAQNVALPPALVLQATVTPQANRSFVVVIDIQNVGSEAAQGSSLTLLHGGALDGDGQEVTLGTLAPGAHLEHVFSVALPPGVSISTATVRLSATNADAEAVTVGLEAN